MPELCHKCRFLTPCPMIFAHQRLCPLCCERIIGETHRIKDYRFWPGSPADLLKQQHLAWWEKTRPCSHASLTCPLPNP